MNYEAGIYDHNSGDDLPKDIVDVSRTNATGTTPGVWKVVTGLNIPLNASTDYWIAVQVDNSTGTQSNRSNTGKGRSSPDAGATTLNDPWTSELASSRILSIYALITFTPPEEGTNFQINVDDSLKEVSAIKVQVDDSWKAVSAAKVNKDDAWKTIF